MRRTRLDPAGRERGVTLLEMVVAMVLVAIVIGATFFLTYPIQQAGDVTVRAQLTDIADNALQRIGRDVRLAVPNSVRVTTDVSGVSYLEFVPVRTAGRYRAENNGTCNGAAASDALTFNIADGCFRALGTIPNFADVVPGGATDFLVLNNYGVGFSGQNVYDASPTNIAYIDSVTSAEVRLKSTPSPPTFDRKLHESPGRRFYIAAPPVTYRCDPTAGTLTRHTGYPLSSSFPNAALPAGVLLANLVSVCSFGYSPNVAPSVGLLTLRLSLAKSVSTGTETVSLYHAIHVHNVP